MARLGLIVLLLVCMTITGVYAVWTYAGTNDIADQMTEVGVTIGDVTVAGVNGIYTINSNLKIVVDQESSSSHKAVLDFQATDSNPIYLTVTFTPDEKATEEIKAEGVASYIYFTSDMKYDGADIFSFAGNHDVVWTRNAETGVFSYTLNQSQLEQLISINEFVLDTKAEYDVFKAALTSTIKAYVSDGNQNQ